MYIITGVTIVHHEVPEVIFDGNNLRQPKQYTNLDVWPHREDLGQDMKGVICKPMSYKGEIAIWRYIVALLQEVDGVHAPACSYTEAVIDNIILREHK